jgi:hypothetical protein
VPWQASASFPFCHSYVADALGLRQAYAEAVDAWYVWLETGKDPSNGEQLLLWRLIDLTLTRRGKDGAWENLDDKIVPTVQVLNNVIDQAKYHAFESVVTSQRQAMENAALALVTLLDTAELRTEFNGLPDVQRWEYAAQLADGLAGSNVGMLCLRKSVTADASPLPVIHPDQFTKSTLSWQTASSLARRAARAYAHAVLKVLPALLADEQSTAFRALGQDFVDRFFPEGVVTGPSLEEKVSQAEEWLKSNQPWWASESLASGVQAGFDVLNLGLAVFALASAPSTANLAAVARAASSLVSSASSWAKVAFGEESLLVISKSTSAVLADLNLVYDVWMGARALYASSEAARTGDYSVAVGQAMQGVGLATAAGVAAYTATIAGAALIPGLQLLALGALLLILAGIVIATYTVDSPFEQWLQNCWFGSNWASVTADEGPGTPMYRSRRVDGTPDIARQVSFWLSVFYPIRLKVTKGSNPTDVNLACEPTLAFPQSQVNVWRIDDQGTITPGPFVQIPIYGKPIDDLSDPRVVHTVTGTPPDERILDWIATFGSRDWSQGTSATFDMSGHWVEVEMTLPAGFAPELTAQIMGNSLPGFSFPLITRMQAKVG